MIDFAIAIFVATLSLGINYLLQKKPKLLFHRTISQIPIPASYFVNYNSGNDTNETQTTSDPRLYGMHTIVLSNQGNATAHNVRIGHFILPPAYSISKRLGHLNTSNPNEILIPTLCPKEEVVISYLYHGQIPFTIINSYIKCDTGLAKEANLKHFSIKSPFLIYASMGIFFIGVATTAYWGIKIFEIFHVLYGIANPG